MKMLEAHKTIIVLEEMISRGGLADAIKSIAWQFKSNVKIRTYSLKNKFVHCYGSHDDVLQAHGLDVNKICDEFK
jgi:transketolase